MSYLQELLDYNSPSTWARTFVNAWYGTPQNPKPAPAPAAPQTPEQMQTWTPDDLAAADRQNWLEWRKTAIPDLPEGLRDHWQTYAVIGGAIVAGYIALRITAGALRGRL